MTPELGQEEEPKNKYPYIAIMGVTAAGKTTFAEFLARRINGKLFQELPVEDNPFFTEYYENPTEYALPTQMFLVYEKWLQTKGSRKMGVSGVRRFWQRPVVQEPPIYEDALYAQARLEKNPRQWDWYQNFYEGLVNMNLFPKPDLIVFLHLRLPVMLVRIRERAKKNPERKSELGESEAYWERLRWLQESWVKENPLGLRIVTLDMDRFDFSGYNSGGEALEAAYQELKNRSGGLIK